MSDQHESVPAGEPVVVEPVEDHDTDVAPVDAESVDHGPADDTESVEPQDVNAGEEGVSPGEVVPEDEPVDYQAERYAQACVDPDYARAQAIDVADEDKGPAWEVGSLAQHTVHEANRAQVEADQADDHEGEGV